MEATGDKGAEYVAKLEAENATYLKQMEEARIRNCNYAKEYYRKNTQKHCQNVMLRYYKRKLGEELTNYFIVNYGFEIGLLQLKLYLREQQLLNALNETLDNSC